MIFKQCAKIFFNLVLIAAAIWSPAAQGKNESQQDLLVKFSTTNSQNSASLSVLRGQGNKVEPIGDHWVRIQVRGNRALNWTLATLNQDSQVEFIQPNYKVHLPENYKIQDSLLRAAFARGWGKNLAKTTPDPVIKKPEIPPAPLQQLKGPDPLFENQWGMIDIGVKDAWKISRGTANMIVAVIDTGVDYTHEDLLPNIWRNSGETGVDTHGNRKENNGVDDDGNGFIDDVVGWDFVSNDNKPYDLTTPWQDLIMGGGNPGHGTHCAGNVGARGDNAIGISGVAPEVKIMAIRFISEKGSGNTADAVKAIRYAVDNGAKILSNSWGSEGEKATEAPENKALREAVQYAQDHGVLFIAAAGNGHGGVGYDNDTDAAPGYPASYPYANIISVAAVDRNDHLGGFSNWGAKTVHIGAPGVAIYSSMVGNRYSDKVLDVGGFEADWDGTSMATPHVAGAAALYWSANPGKTWQEVKAAILSSARRIPALSGKVVSDGKLDVRELMKR